MPPEMEYEERRIAPDAEGEAEIIEIVPKGYEPEEETDDSVPYAPQDFTEEQREARGISLEDAEKYGEAVAALGRGEQLSPEDLSGLLTHRSMAFEIKADDEEEGASKGPSPIEFVLSSQDADRDGDIVTTSGWVLKHFRKNPVWLWAHMGRELPIGRVVKVVKDLQAQELRAFVEFAPESLNPFADFVMRMHRAKFLRATSAGFLVLRVKSVTDEQRDALGMRRWSILSVKHELVEGSSVTIPSNRRALQKSVGAAAATGLITARDLPTAETLWKNSDRANEREAFLAIDDAWSSLNKIVVSAAHTQEEAETLKRLDAALSRMSGHAVGGLQEPITDKANDTDLYDDALLGSLDDATSRLSRANG